MKVGLVFESLISFFVILLYKAMGKRIHGGWISFISPKAILRTTGRTSRIELGNRTGIRGNTELHADKGSITIGRRCFINRNCMIVAHERVDVEDGVTIGPGVCIYDHDHDGKRGYTSSPITVKRGAWIGAGCILLKGVTVGENAVVAAGTIVVKDIPANTAVYQERKNVYKARSSTI